MRRAARVQAQAKINIWLHILGRFAEGYHEIFTMFQRVDLADDVLVRTSDEFVRTIACAGPRMPPGGLGPDKKNLAFRAAEEYHAHTGWPRGFAIEVTKNIPVGGGLGGGSADAGAVLRALNALAPKPLDSEALLEIGAKLGADVAFLASDHVRAWAVGIGDKIFAPPGLPGEFPAADVLLVVPDFGISTAEAYRWLDESGHRRDDQRQPSGAVALKQSSPWGGLFEGNDFETVVEERYPLLQSIRQRLGQAGAKIARLSGSGSTVFGLFEGSAPDPGTLGLDALVIPTRTSSRVVQVEVLE